MPEKTYTEKELKAAIYEALTIQLLRLRIEVFENGGMSQADFDKAHFGGRFQTFERKLAKREGIPLA